MDQQSVWEATQYDRSHPVRVLSQEELCDARSELVPIIWCTNYGNYLRDARLKRLWQWLIHRHSASSPHNRQSHGVTPAEHLCCNGNRNTEWYLEIDSNFARCRPRYRRRCAATHDPPQREDQFHWSKKKRQKLDSDLLERRTREEINRERKSGEYWAKLRVILNARDNLEKAQRFSSHQTDGPRGVDGVVFVHSDALGRKLESSEDVFILRKQRERNRSNINEREPVERPVSIRLLPTTPSIRRPPPRLLPLSSSPYPWDKSRSPCGASGPHHHSKADWRPCFFLLFLLVSVFLSPEYWLSLLLSLSRFAHCLIQTNLGWRNSTNYRRCLSEVLSWEWRCENNSWNFPC